MEEGKKEEVLEEKRRVLQIRLTVDRSDCELWEKIGRVWEWRWRW
jgi:hypothetical protein